MSSLDEAQLHQYILDLPLAFHDVKLHGVSAAKATTIAAADVDSGAKAAVAGASIQVFLPGVTPQMQQDILNSRLLAQLAAQNEAGGGPEKNPEVWYAKYREVLGHVGWTIDQFDMSKIDVSQYNNAADVILKLSEGYLTPNEQALLAKSISVVTDPSNSKPYGILNNSAISVSNHSAGFNVGVASAHQGNPTFKVGFMYYTCNTNIRKDGFLWFKFDSSDLDVDFRAGNQTMTLNSKFYETIRDKVTRKLGRNITNYIDSLNLRT